MKLPKRRLNPLTALTMATIAGSAAVTAGHTSPIESNRPKSVFVYATKVIPENAVIKDEDLQETWLYDGKNPPHSVPCRNFAVGYCAKYRIEEGQILVEEILNRGLPVIKPNELNHTTCSKTFTVRPKRTIAAGSTIEKSDLRTESINPYTDPKNCVARIDDVIGAKAKSVIKEGQIITTDLIVKAR